VRLRQLAPEVQLPPQNKERDMLIDSTLREGAQAYGVYFGGGAKRRMAELLAAAGVEELECGWIGQQDLPEFLAWAQSALAAPAAGGPALSLWCPCREADVREAAKLAGPGCCTGSTSARPPPRCTAKNVWGSPLQR